MPSSCDVLFLTVTSVETQALYTAIQKINGGIAPKSSRKGTRIYHDLGMVNDASLMHTQCQMGTGGRGAALQAIEQSIQALSPGCVIMVGIAFGMNPKKQKIGDVLVSEQLHFYEPEKLKKDGSTISRGVKSDATGWLLQIFQSLKAQGFEGETLDIGLVLSGEKLIDNLEFRDRLKELEPEAIGGEMEGAGLYAACQDNKVDWILVKGICDWADGNKSRNKQARQKLAATNAAQIVAKALNLISFKRPEVAAPRPFDTNLRTGRGTFVGRENSIQHIGKWALSGTTGVLCLWGPGGVGKTRLAEEAGLALVGDKNFDLIKLVSFEALKPDTATGQQVASTIALALGAENVDEAAQDLPRFVKSKGERALLILDNFESADNADTQNWLANFVQSGIRCLVTSRKQITVHNVSQNLAVTCLEVPTSADEDFDYLPAVDLFRDRLGESVKLPPYEELSAEDREGLVEILKITGGFPLAIEIVAANRIYASGSLRDIAEKLGVHQIRYREELGDSGGGAERHESMGACLQWSLDLLPKDEAKRFATLGIFPYDFSLKAAETICGVTDIDLTRWWQRSLVQQDSEKPGSRRFLLPLLKEYAWHTCEEEVQRRIAARAVNFFVDMVKSFVHNGHIDINKDSVRATLDLEWRSIFSFRKTAISIDNFDNFRILNDIYSFLILRSLLIEAEEMWEYALEVIRNRIQRYSNKDTSLRIYESVALSNLGTIYLQRGRLKDGVDYLESSLEIKREIDYRRGIGLSLMNLGNAYSQIGAWEKSIEHHEESLSIFISEGDIRNASGALSNLGNVYSQQGNWDKAIECCKHSIESFHILEDRHGEAQAQTNLGSNYRQQGNWDNAIKCFEQSLDIFQSLGDRHGEGLALTNLGITYSQQGNRDKALQCFEDSLDIFQSLGDRYGEGKVKINFGTVYLHMGQWDDALSCLKESLIIFSEFGDKHGECLVKGNIGNIFRQKGDFQMALLYYNESSEMSSKLGDSIEFGRTTINIGITYGMQGDMTKSIDVIQSGIDILAQTQDVKALEWGREMLSQALRNLNNKRELAPVTLTNISRPKRKRSP